MHGQREQPAEDPTLRILMAEYQAGSADAFNRLHDALAPELRAFLAMLSRDASRADDLLQETFLQIHRSRAVHTPGEPVRPWVFAIAKRVFLMYRRSASRRARHESVPAVPAHAGAVNPIGAEHLHARREVKLALQHAPASARRAFVLHHLFGWSFKDVAAKLGVTPATAKMRSSRAAAFMRAFLREHRDE